LTLVPTTSATAVRDPVADHLITPQNSALLVIDYQPTQLESVRSMDHDLLLNNAIALERVAQAGGKPISWVSLAGELQRDWGREETVPEMVQIVLTERLLKE